jgi:hypothetical protein
MCILECEKSPTTTRRLNAHTPNPPFALSCVTVLPKYNRFQTQSNLEITQHVRALAAIARGCAVNDETSSTSFKSVVSDQIKLEGIILNTAIFQQ